MFSKEDLEDLYQYRAEQRLKGSKATNWQLEIDFMRENFGDSRYTSKDAMKHPRLGDDVALRIKDEHINNVDKFIEDIAELNLSQRVISCLYYCGLSLGEISRILKMNQRAIGPILTGEVDLLVKKRRSKK